MRILIACLFFLPLSANANHMDILLKRECDERIDPSVTYFTCQVDNRGLYIHILKEKSKLSESQFERAKIYFRYITHWYLDTEGRSYKLTYEYSDEVKICSAIQNRTGYHCKEYRQNSDGSLSEVEK